jgi:hypothetical protein
MRTEMEKHMLSNNIPHQHDFVDCGSGSTNR